jgi:hypothetical protein
MTISDAPHYLEVDWHAGTNGGLTFYKDEVLQGTISGIANDTLKIDSVRLGAVNAIDNGTRGTEFFDAFESRRQTQIGP